jgi:hypothetical protein
MEQSVHTSPKGRLQKSENKNKKKESLSVLKAIYLKDYELLLYFSNGEQRIVNFVSLLSSLSGAYSKYLLPQNFKKFIVKNGNVYWGKNEDVIFSVDILHNGNFSKKPKEEIMYVM